jgi:AAA+ superfamily predicted ATPase
MFWEFLTPHFYLDRLLVGIVKTLPTAPGPALPPSQQQLQADIVTLLQSATTTPLVQLCGFDSATKQAIATAACAELHYGLLKVTADRLPTDGNQLYLVQTLWEREALLTRSLLLLDCDNLPETSEGIQTAPPQLSAIARLVETCHHPMLVFSRDRRSAHQRPVFNFEITPPTTTEQRQLWQQSLKAVLEAENNATNGTAPITTQIDKLVSHFSLSPLAIQTVCNQGLAQQSASLYPSHLSEFSATDSTLAEHLWRACLSYARPKLEELAQPIRTQVTWDDLVLPDKEKQILQTITAQVRQRAKVYEKWGFANKGQRGLGISALFAGSSGTGKTLAAEVLANELHLDLYRIDLSSVVSKYIGETEKNLRRIFDAAEMGGAILLFDEADALFGKRSEVKDSHDRYANMEVAYLLQRMEAYRGLAILTTNLKNALDQAFLRRLRFVVQFPFPDAVQRAEIWQRVFPKLTPTENLSYQKLARLNVPGGNIRNIALNAAFLAADADLPVQMQHILQSAQSEYIKLERPLTEAEIKGWGE